MIECLLCVHSFLWVNHNEFPNQILCLIADMGKFFTIKREAGMDNRVMQTVILFLFLEWIFG